MPGRLSQYHSIKWRNCSIATLNPCFVFPEYQPIDSSTSRQSVVTTDDPGTTNRYYNSSELANTSNLAYRKSSNPYSQMHELLNKGEGDSMPQV